VARVTRTLMGGVVTIPARRQATCRRFALRSYCNYEKLKFLPLKTSDMNYYMFALPSLVNIVNISLKPNQEANDGYDLDFLHKIFLLRFEKS
jgi:hypothetical protein